MKFFKRGKILNKSLSTQAQELSFKTMDYSYLCKLCQPLALCLENKHYFKFQWMGCTMVYWKDDDKIYKELY